MFFFLYRILHTLLFFFFSSRRRHTRWPRDWSSDVCSSDLWNPIQLASIAVMDSEVSRRSRLRGCFHVSHHRCLCDGLQKGFAHDSTSLLRFTNLALQRKTSLR